MTLIVPFDCRIRVVSLGANYTGHLTLANPGGRKLHYYFLVLNPYGGTRAEFGLYNDAEMQKSFAELTGVGVLEINPRTGKSVTAYEFDSLPNAGVIGIAFVASQIISEAICRSDIKAAQTSATEFTYSHVWQQNFIGTAENYAQAFVEACIS